MMFKTLILIVVVMSAIGTSFQAESPLRDTGYLSNLVLDIGKKEPDDHLISEDSLQWSRLEDGQTAHVHSFPGDNVSIINNVVVKSLTKNDLPLVSLVHGGPGNTFATLRFEFSKPQHQLLYSVELYGKIK